ncbi:MAG: FAD-binding oxidoreductase [Merismopedia sp. SIO2A8]|nr:FAD-binding oxidoreductase [Merismopedia sp. SIO2A8]
MERVPFARWFYGLQISEEYELGSAPESTSRLHGLSYRELLHIQEDDPFAHAARYDLRFQTMKQTGLWKQSHPWLECMLPLEVAMELLPKIIPQLPIFLGDGHRIITLANVPRPRFSIQPAGFPTVLFAVLPMGVSPELLQPALAALGKIHQQVIEAGGKRYLSGWLFEPSEEAWSQHYGSEYEAWQARKRTLDPYGLFESCLFPTPITQLRSKTDDGQCLKA